MIGWTWLYLNKNACLFIGIDYYIKDYFNHDLNIIGFESINIPKGNPVNITTITALSWPLTFAKCPNIYFYEITGIMSVIGYLMSTLISSLNPKMINQNFCIKVQMIIFLYFQAWVLYTVITSYTTTTWIARRNSKLSRNISCHTLKC